MPYEYITNRDSFNYWSPEDLAGYCQITIDTLTIHHWGEVGAQFWPTVDWVCRQGGDTSAHEVIEAGRVAQLINFGNAAWHSGSFEGNTTSYSLELNPRASDGDYATAAERIADIWATYGYKPLRPHKSWSATACPGAYDLGRLEREAQAWFQALHGDGVAPDQPQPQPAGQQWEPLAWYVEPGDTLGRIARHYGSTVAAVAAHNGIQDPNSIEVGQQVLIPGPLVWHVERGDTLAKVAAHYGVGVDRLVSLNGIQDPDRIEVGQVLVVQP